MKNKIKFMRVGLFVIIMLGLLAPASVLVGAAFPYLNPEFSQMSNDLSYEDGLDDGQFEFLFFAKQPKIPLVNWNS